MHLNKCLVIGRVTSAGAKLTYSEKATPTCRFWLEVVEPGAHGQQYTSYIPCEVTGAKAEDLAATLTAGLDVLSEGRLRYRKDEKDGKKGGLVVSSWYATIGATASDVSQN